MPLAISPALANASPEEVRQAVTLVFGFLALLIVAGVAYLFWHLHRRKKQWNTMFRELEEHPAHVEPKDKAAD